MSKQKFNNSITNTRLGARNIKNSFGNIYLNKEANDFLDEIGGLLSVIYSPHTEKPEIKIVGDKGKVLATIDEFALVANYKAIIGGKMENNKREKELVKETALYKNSRAQALLVTGSVSPDRMLEANDQRFRQTIKAYKNVKKNGEVIETLPNGPSKNYLLEKIGTLKQVLIFVLISCTGSDKFETETYTNRLFECGIPKWLEGKLIDVNFTKDVRTTADPLIFSKGNFMKSICLSGKEIRSDGFMALNREILINSHGFIQLARSREYFEFITESIDGTDEDKLNTYEKFLWPMMGNGTVEEHFNARLNRNRIVGFSPTLAPKAKPGQSGFRPETTNQRVSRETRNKHGLIISTMMDFFHFIPRVDDPVNDFWVRYFNTGSWEITPENHLYRCINNEERRDAILEAISNNSLQIVKRQLADMVLLRLSIPRNSSRGNTLHAIISSLGTNNSVTNYPGADVVLQSINNLPGQTFDQLEDVSGVISTDNDTIKEFRGKATADKKGSLKDDRDNVQNTVELGKLARRELKKITDENLRKDVTDWIKANFRKRGLQNLAARRAVSAVATQNLGYEVDSSDEELDSHSEGDY